MATLPNVQKNSNNAEFPLGLAAVSSVPRMATRHGVPHSKEVARIVRDAVEEIRALGGRTAGGHGSPRAAVEPADAPQTRVRVRARRRPAQAAEDPSAARRALSSGRSLRQSGKSAPPYCGGFG